MQISTNLSSSAGGKPTYDTRANILASTPAARTLAVSSDTLEFFFYTGSAWEVLPFALIPDASGVDMGPDIRESRIGINPPTAYQIGSIADYLLAHCVVGKNNQRTETGAVRISSTNTLQVYVSGIWYDLMYGSFRFRESAPEGYALEHEPVGFYDWYECFSGNDTIIALNGLPIIQQYTASMGAYPIPLHIDGGTE